MLGAENGMKCAGGAAGAGAGTVSWTAPGRAARCSARPRTGRAYSHPRRLLVRDAHSDAHPIRRRHSDWRERGRSRGRRRRDQAQRHAQAIDPLRRSEAERGGRRELFAARGFRERHRRRSQAGTGHDRLHRRVTASMSPERSQLSPSAVSRRISGSAIASLRHARSGSDGAPTPASAPSRSPARSRRPAASNTRGRPVWCDPGRRGCEGRALPSADGPAR